MAREPSVKFLPAEKEESIQATIEVDPRLDQAEPEEPSAAKVEVPHDPAVEKQLERARKKFTQMDVDGNGVLNGSELDVLAKWVFDSFHPGGEPIDEETKKKEAAKLLSRIDKNTDGVLEFEEFAGWF